MTVAAEQITNDCVDDFGKVAVTREEHFCPVLVGARVAGARMDVAGAVRNIDHVGTA